MSKKGLNRKDLIRLLEKGDLMPKPEPKDISLYFRDGIPGIYRITDEGEVIEVEVREIDRPNGDHQNVFFLIDASSTHPLFRWAGHRTYLQEYFIRVNEYKAPDFLTKQGDVNFVVFFQEVLHRAYTAWKNTSRKTVNFRKPVNAPQLGIKKHAPSTPTTTEMPRFLKEEAMQVEHGDRY